MTKRIENLKTLFLRHGFLCCPLTNEELDDLITRQWSDDTIYNIGCDVHCGHSFDEALAYAMDYDEMLFDDGWYRPEQTGLEKAMDALLKSTQPPRGNGLVLK